MRDRARLRVLTLLPVVGHPRDSKRIDMLRESGAEVQAAAFSRDHPVARVPQCDVTHLGAVKDGHYLRRAIYASRALVTVYRLAAAADVIYASGQDMALIGLVAGLMRKRPVVMEVGDIREIQLSRSLGGVVVRWIDRWIARRVAFMVVTSGKFVTEYYAPLLGRAPDHIVIENKLELSSDALSKTAPSPRRRDGDPLTIGYFGVLRFQWALDALEAVLKANPRRFRLLLAGYLGGADPSRLVELGDQVTYFPSYRSPEDLPRLYAAADLVWCAYPVAESGHSGKNWVRANRFYEACHFRKPLIVLHGTGDAQPVAEQGLGLVLVSDALPDVVEAVSSITVRDLETWQGNLRRLPVSTYAYSNEVELLRSKLDQAALR